MIIVSCITMSVILGIASHVQNAGSLLFSGLNILVLALLISKATSMFIDELAKQNKQQMSSEIFRTHLRLQSFWLAVMIVLTATVLKLVLSAQLADQIIAAWFVGQGFALQPYIQSYISGIVFRSNGIVSEILRARDLQSYIKYNNKKYKWKEQHILSLTLQEKDNEEFIVVPWTRLNEMVFVK